MCSVFIEHCLTCPSLRDFVTHVAHTGDYLSFYREHGLPEATRDELHAIYLPTYRGSLHTVKTMPGVIYTLQELHQNNTEVHLLTAARKDMADMLIDHAGIRQNCDDFHYHVHNKEMQIRAIIDGMEITPDECVMIGDLPSDVMHATRAGIRGVALQNKHVPTELFETVTNMEYYANDFRGLLAYIAQHSA